MTTAAVACARFWTDDTGSVSATDMAVDAAPALYLPGEVARREVHSIGSLRAAPNPERMRSARSRRVKPRGAFQRLVPSRRPQLAVSCIVGSAPRVSSSSNASLLRIPPLHSSQSYLNSRRLSRLVNSQRDIPDAFARIIVQNVERYCSSNPCDGGSNQLPLHATAGDLPALPLRPVRGSR